MKHACHMLRETSHLKAMSIKSAFRINQLVLCVIDKLQGEEGKNREGENEPCLYCCIFVVNLWSCMSSRDFLLVLHLT